MAKKIKNKKEFKQAGPRQLGDNAVSYHIPKD
jgi:hypothetical protein